MSGADGRLFPPSLNNTRWLAGQSCAFPSFRSACEKWNMWTASLETKSIWDPPDFEGAHVCLSGSCHVSRISASFSLVWTRVSWTDHNELQCGICILGSGTRIWDGSTENFPCRFDGSPWMWAIQLSNKPPYTFLISLPIWQTEHFYM